jgi:Domain of unknown function (DUF6378)
MTSSHGPSHRVPESPITAEQLLEQAASVVAQRRGEYGKPVDLFEQIAQRWSFVLGVEVSPAQTVLCMLEIKTTRLSRDPKHLDSITDVAGYAAVLAELLSDA